MSEDKKFRYDKIYTYVGKVPKYKKEEFWTPAPTKKSPNPKLKKKRMAFNAERIFVPVDDKELTLNYEKIYKGIEPGSPRSRKN